MSEQGAHVVFDCNVFVQALLNDLGSAGACVQAALDRRIQLFLSPYVLSEVRECPSKSTPRRLGVTSEKVERLISNLILVASVVNDVPSNYDHPIDPDDSHYIDLAIATNSNLIVSRDRHLLGLNDSSKDWSAAFRLQFPDLRVISPEELLRSLRAS